MEVEPIRRIGPDQLNGRDRRGERLVLVFDAEDPNLEVRRLCGDLNSVEVGEPDGRLTLSAAFCVGERVARGAVGAVPRPDSMNTEFKRFLDRVLNEVFPFFSLRIRQ